MPEKTDQSFGEQIPKANIYLIEVRDGIDYEVRAAKCPICGAENTDVEPNSSRVCFGCKNKFEVRLLNKDS